MLYKKAIGNVGRVRIYCCRIWVGKQEVSIEMDLWVVAAAAGAGYLAKHWHDFLRDKEGSSGFPSERIYPDESHSPPLIEGLRDMPCPSKSLSQTRTRIGKFSHSGDIVAKTNRGNLSIESEATCRSTSNHEQEVEWHDNGSVGPQFKMPSEFRSDYNLEEYKDGYGLEADMRDIPENHNLELESSRGSTRHKNFRKSRRLHLQHIKPRTSLDSCLMAQMQREHVDVEEYLLTPLSSPCTPSLRPLFVTDGKRVISRVSYEFRDGPTELVLPKADNGVFGVPHLPWIKGTDYSKLKLNGEMCDEKETNCSSKQNPDGCRSRMEELQYCSKLMQVDAITEFSSGQSLFCLGISVGILSTIISTKVELEKLKQRTKLSENLVDDLQEELEMKNSLTVKELVNYDHDTLTLKEQANDDSHDIHWCLRGNKMDLSSNQPDADEESLCLKEVESISKIEAELEAELERLELSMKSSTLTGILSSSLELDEDSDQNMIAVLVHGELQADNVHRRSSSEPTRNRDSHSLTPESAKYGISPRELTFRLHEVIKSRLEERILELEAELAKNQKRIQHLISERTNYRRDASHSSSSSSKCSPKAIEDHCLDAQPLIMNLSGEALDAYNEAFEELDRLKGFEDGPAPQVLSTSQQDHPNSSKPDISGRLTGLGSSNNAWHPSKGDEAVPISITGIPSSEDSPNEFYNSDVDDLLLIQQIVEKARQGSPAILRAQNAMVSLDRANHL